MRATNAKALARANHAINAGGVVGRVIRVLGAGVLLVSAEVGQASAADLICSTPTTIGSPSVYDNVTLQSGCILTVSASLMVNANLTVASGGTVIGDAAVGVGGDMTIQSGGVVTHSTRLEAGLQLNVTGTLDVQAGGLVDLNEKGLRGAGGGSVFGSRGEAYDDSGNIVAGAAGRNASTNYGAGASYGGVGGNGTGLFGAPNLTNPPYGTIEVANRLGSGGGRDGDGRNGGGRLSLTAGTLVVNGTVRANGGTPGVNTEGGGGSGGGIQIDVLGTLSGSGSIESKGGQASYYSASGAGPGGGGRIAIVYGTLTLPDTNVSAPGGSSNTGGVPFSSAGTVYLKDRAHPYGDLIIDNEGREGLGVTPFRTSLASFRHVTVRDSLLGPFGSRLSVTGALVLENTIPPETIVRGAAVTADAAGLLGGGLPGNTFGSAGQTVGADWATVSMGSTNGSGGSYGGFGGGPTVNPLYGLAGDPKEPGSGGSRSTGSGFGGSGGGKIWIEAGSCSIPAGTSITANGGDASDSGSGTQGGGSGGSIRLQCGQVSGTGQIAADGGAGAGTNGNGGGGGRVSVRADANALLLTIRAVGGLGTQGGQAGLQGSVFTDIPPPSGLVLLGVDPVSGGNAGSVTLVVTGTDLDPQATIKLAKAGQADVIGTNVSGVPSRQSLTATFNLGGALPGLWDVVVTNPGDQVSSLPASFEVVQGGQAHLFARPVVPRYIRTLRNYVLRLEYGNDGDVDLPAPLLAVSGTPDVLMSLSPLEPYSLLPVQVLALGPDGALDILPPHSQYSIPIYFRSPDVPGHSFVTFQTSEMPADATPLDWTALEQGVRPPDVANDAWSAIWTNVQEQVGSTRADYRDALMGEAVFLGAHGSRIHSVRDLFNFEMLRARGGTTPRSTLDEATDLFIGAPGLPLVFSREAHVALDERLRLGPLGRGRTHSFEVSVVSAGPNEAIVRGPHGSRRRFTKPVGPWVAEIGDTGVLSDRAGGGYLLREKDGQVWAFTVDGSLEYTEEPNGNRLTMSYTSGQLSRVEHSNGRHIDLQYSGNGRLIEVSDDVGRQVEYGYDGSGEHLVSVLSFGDRETLYAYLPVTGSRTDHALAEITFPDGTHTYFDYDARGRLVAESRDGDTEREEYVYVEPGEVQTHDAAGGTEVTFHGHDGRRLDHLDATGNRLQVTYGPDARPAVTTWPDGTETRYAYDSKLNTRLVENEGDRLRSYGYTPDLSRLDWFMDGKGNVTDYESDAQGNLTSITYPNLLSRTYTHDAAGNLTSATNRRSDTITLTHDANGRPFQKIYPGGRTITYGFDARDNLTSAADTATGTILMQYNASDQLTRIDYPGGRWLGFTYDDAGRRTQRTGHDGYVLNYEYDALGRTSYLTDGPGLEIASYEYDATGRITRENKGNGTYTTYDYDAAGEVLAIVHHDPAGEVQSRFDYDYDAQGRRTSVTTLTGTTTYSYDAIGQLTGAAYSAGQSVFYDYDAAGNRTSVLDDGVESSYSTNEMNQCLQAGSVAYQYDDDGNLVQRMDAGGTTTYEYDSENRLVRVVTPTSEMFEYTYDALGNRASVSHDGSITAFLEDPDGLGNVVADYDGSGNLIARYLHGSTLLAREDPLGARQFYGYDAVGNAALLTGPSGAVANSYTYDPFGRPLVSSETVANPFKFDGQEGVRTDETGLGFMRARMYDFETGRFTSEDPIGLAGGPNLYAFVDNEPTDSTDPSGLKGVRDCHDAKSTYYLDDPCNCAACMPDVGPVLDRCTRRNSEQEHQCLIDCRIVRASQESFQACATNCMEISDRYNWLECRDVRRWLNKEQKCEDDCHVFPLEPLDWPPPPCTPYLTCPPCDGCDEGSSEALTPLDPNEKIGLPGYGSEGFTTGGEPLPYIIYFENQPTASAPAQEVFVTDILDPDADWSSFSLDEIAFGDTVVDSLAGLSSGSVTVPLPGTSLVVSIVVDYNPASGVVQWALRTIDPLTNDLPDDALAGFLPPEDGTGRGDGHVAFTVSPRASRPTGTVLTNQASIVFDTNAAIATNTWTNTLDIGGPASSIVSVVPAPGGGPMDRLVTWSGSDDAGGSGIQDYTIYISEDAGPYAAWQTDVTDTSGVITVLCDRVYRFYSRARDHVGNVEAAPAGPDQTDSFAQCNDGDACTIDACDQGAGCLHTPLQPPAETSGVTVSQSGIDTQIAWTLATNATRSEVLRGLLSALPVGPGGDDETCLGGDLGVTTVTDTEVPPENTGYWYLIRGVNSCFGNGSYGFEEVGGLPGAPRVSTTCP